MNITSAKYLENGTIEVGVNGNTRLVPNDIKNWHRAALAQWEVAGNFIEPFTPSPPTVDDVRIECQRRLMILVGARDQAHLAIIKSNGQEAAIDLLNIGEKNWNPAQVAQASHLADVRVAFEAIRAASNALETFDPIPLDFADDKHWP